MRALETLSPVMEVFSVDEAFLDLTDMQPLPVGELARRFGMVKARRLAFVISRS